MLIKGLDYEHIGGEEYNPYGRQYKTLRDYTFFLRTEKITIPAGYKWDGPTAVPFVNSVNSGWLEPSLRHDFLYEEQGSVDGVHYTREEADKLFHKDLRDNGVSWIYIFIMKTFLDGTFEKVWTDTTSGTSQVLKKYMVPFILAAFAFGTLVTTGAIVYAPAIWGLLQSLLI